MKFVGRLRVREKSGLCRSRRFSVVTASSRLLPAKSNLSLRSILGLHFNRLISLRLEQKSLEMTSCSSVASLVFEVPIFLRLIIIIRDFSPRATGRQTQSLHIGISVFVVGSCASVKEPSNHNPVKTNPLVPVQVEPRIILFLDGLDSEHAVHKHFRSLASTLS